MNTVVPWPAHLSEMEVQFAVYQNLVNDGFEARMNVPAKNGILDIVIYKDQIAKAIIEVKVRNCGWSPTQFDRYAKLGLPMFLFNEESSYGSLSVFVTQAVAGLLRAPQKDELISVALTRLEQLSETNNQWMKKDTLFLAAKIGFCGSDIIDEALNLLEAKGRLKFDHKRLASNGHAPMHFLLKPAKRKEKTNGQANAA